MLSIWLNYRQYIRHIPKDIPLLSEHIEVRRAVRLTVAATRF
jgi:hypothetical protein